MVVEKNIDSSVLGAQQISYSVKDSSNNETKIFRKISVIDDEKPVIDIKRNVNTYVIIGNKININNYTATDNYDGDLTDKVVVDGEVNFNKVGLYNITYTVSDSNNNITTIKSTINVQKKNTKGIPVLMYH